MHKPYLVQAAWDADAGVWVATSEQVPGLVTEAVTLEALAAKLQGMVPELLEANGREPAPWHVAVAPPPERRIGSLRGRLVVPDDFDAPLPDDVLESFEGGAGRQ